MTKKLPLTYEEFKSIYSKVTRLAVEVLAYDERGFVLVLRKGNGWHDRWHIPGSTVYYKEKILDAIARCAQEELGITVEMEQFLGVNEYHSEEKERGFGYTVTLMYLCRITSGDPRPDENGEKAEFFKAIPENTIDEHLEVLQKVIDMKKF